jgi:alkylation response protein AidB-like acyl-CoA dehydrogenase
MDLDFTEEQEMLRKAARDFLLKECPKTQVRSLEEDERGYDPEMQKKIADLGWLGLIIPVEYDGMGMTFQNLTIVLEEIGRNILPGPFFCTVIEGSIPILEAGTEEQKKEFLPKIANGDLIFTMAFLEASGRYEASGISVKAVPENDSFIINGTKLFVEQANNADYLICVTRTKEEISPDSGLTLFIVNAKTPGVNWRLIPTMGMNKLCEVCFDDVVVPRKNILGQRDEGWPVLAKIMEKAVIAKCAESIGGMQACIDMTVAYMKERVQYERPIGAFQALQHMAADMWIKVQTSRYFVYQVSWMASEGLPCSKEAAMAKAYVNEAYKQVTQKAVQIHGAIGTTRDHDIGLYVRRAKTADIFFGNTDFQRNLIADKIGLVS